MRTSHLIFVAFAVQTLVGCTTVRSFWSKLDDDASKSTDDVVSEAETFEKTGADAKAVKATKAPGPRAKTSQKDEQELKLARLWSRVDDLEEQNLRNKERIRVLEKGITLGLVPEELKNGGKKVAPIVKEPLYESHDPAPKAVKAAVSAEPANEAKEEKAEPHDKGAGGMSKEDEGRYQAALASANELYRSGRYGRAIVEFDKIGKDFAGKAEGGMHKYWIGKCWANLKEFNTARQILVDFLTENASSPWIPRGKLELARVEWKLGLQDTSLQRFKEIIQAYPNEDAAEMAKMELDNLGKTL